MSKKITDAEFEVVRPSDADISTEISKHLITLVVSLIVFAASFYFGATSARNSQALFLGSAGVSFAAAVKSGWSLFAAIRQRRRAK